MSDGGKGASMIATNELRFVERVNNHRDIIRVLQQKWCAPTSVQGTVNPYKYEWRDVPCVKEQA